MIVDEQIDPKLIEAVKRIVRACDPCLIYLFGSQARGDASDESDYDLMVIVPDSDSPAHKHAQRAYRELWGVGVPVEIVVFTQDQFERQSMVVASLAATVRREGRLLYEHR
jgi:uncharacterized protein